MSTETTRGSLTREEIERVISDIIGAEDVRIIRHGIGSGDPSEVYGWVYDSEDEHPYRSETTPDDLFDPEAEGWPTRDENGGGWMHNVNLQSWAPDRDATEMWGVTEHVPGRMRIFFRRSGKGAQIYYDGAPLPHAAVVSILIANGYEPEGG